MYLKQITLLVIAVTSLPATGLAESNPVYHYEPEKVKLVGTLEQQTFPGLPNYENIKTGDEVEKGWYLRLDRPIDVVASKKDVDPNAGTEKDVKVMHLTFNPDASGADVMKKVGKKVILGGHLIHRISGHQHSRVLMWVDEVRERGK